MKITKSELRKLIKEELKDFPSEELNFINDNTDKDNKEREVKENFYNIVGIIGRISYRSNYAYGLIDNYEHIEDILTSTTNKSLLNNTIRLLISEAKELIKIYKEI